jgi:hypothetical protein
MSGNPQKLSVRQDDIDLIALLERGISFFKKYRWIFLAAILIGLLAGYLRYRSLPTVYKSKLILQSAVLSNQNAIQIIDNWNALLKSGEYTELSKLFNCNEDVLTKTKELKAEEIQKIFTPNNPNGFVLTAMVTDISTLGDLQKGIVYGFNNSESVKEKLDLKKLRFLELIDKTNTEIQRLDSTKRTVESILNGNRSGSSLMIDVSGISRQIIELNEKNLFYKEEIKLTTGMQVLQSFSKFKNPAGPNLFVWLFLGLVSCLSIAFLFTLFISINQKLKKRTQLQKEPGIKLS